MTPDSYFAPLAGQSLLYPGTSEQYRGQCVQSVELWLKATGTIPPIYPSAYLYFSKGIPGYVPVSEPTTGDIAVWDATLPGSEGNGHISVVAAPGTRADFYSWDSNWAPPLKLEQIHHNDQLNGYLLGFLRKGVVMDDNKAADLGTEAYRACLHREPESRDAAIAMGHRFDPLTVDSVYAALLSIIESPEWQGQDKALKTPPVTSTTLTKGTYTSSTGSAVTITVN